VFEIKQLSKLRKRRELNEFKRLKKMKEKKEEGRWLSEEPNGWLGGILFMCLYCGAFFGFNAARTFMDGRVPLGLRGSGQAVAGKVAVPHQPSRKGGTTRNIKAA